MKNVLIGLGILLTVVLYARLARADEEFKPTTLVEAPEMVFAPMGFDSNDNIQIVLFGYLPDTCHKAGTVSFRVDEAKKTIYVKNQILYYTGCWCADVLTPYSQTLNLGVLAAGNYQIQAETKTGKYLPMGTIPIAVSTKADADDYLYAPVDNVHLNKGQGAEPTELVLVGAFRNTCMFLEEVKVTYRPNNVVEVQPVAGMQKGNDCAPDFRLFSAKVELKAGLSGPTLIHVRSLNGNSVNQVFEL